MPDEKKPDEKPGTDDKKGAAEVEALRAELADTNKRLKEVTEESIGRRKELQELKPLKGLSDVLRQAFGVEGDASAIEAKVKEVTAQSQSKMRSILLRSEVTAAAAKASMRDPGDAFRMLDLSDVKVDIEKDSVDEKAITERLTALKTSKPYLFADVTPAGAETKKPTAGTQDPGTPPPGAKGSIVEQWQLANKNRDRKAIAELWRKHGPEIGRYIDSLRQTSA